MINVLKTLFNGANARAEDRVKGAYSVELIDQKIREGQTSLRAAKATLASLIQRSRAEAKQVSTLKNRIDDLMARAQEAVTAGREDMASEAAQAVANMENELELRRVTVDRLDSRIVRLRQSVKATNRKIIDLKQGFIAARAIREEQRIQTRLNSTLSGDSPIAEAEELIAGVMGSSDPFEQSEILQEINDGLTHADLGDRMAKEGFGPTTKVTAEDVMKRLATKK